MDKGETRRNKSKKSEVVGWREERPTFTTCTRQTHRQVYLAAGVCKGALASVP